MHPPLAHSRAARILAVAALAAALAAAPDAHAGSNLIDVAHGAGAGSFENGAYVETPPSGSGFMRLVSGATTISGWTVGGASGVDWLSTPQHAAHAGSKSLDLKGTSAGAFGTIETTIPTTIGRTYRLSFGVYSGAVANTGTVSAGGLVNYVFQGPVTASPATAKFAMFHLPFTATSASTTITFKSLASDGFGPVIDDVGVFEGGVGNYLALMNGIEGPYTLPFNWDSLHTGIAKVFDERILHAPTLDPASNTYAAKVSAIEFGVVTDPGVKTISIPLIRLASFSATASQFAAGGWESISVSSGPQFYATMDGPASTTLFEAKDLKFVVNAIKPGGVTEITIPIDPPVVIPVGENALLYIADAPNPAPQSQRFAYSNDESNLCSSFSYFLWTCCPLAPSNLARLSPNEEWMAGLRVVDAVTIPINGKYGPGGWNAHYANGFDSGSGARTLSAVNSPSADGTSYLAFLTYDENSSRGPAAHLMFGNLGGVAPWASPCGAVTQIATGGPYGPVLLTAPPEKPRLVPQIDTLTNAMLSSAVWVGGTTHDTYPGGANVPWYPIPTVGNSGASGKTGGFMIPLPALIPPAYYGVELYFGSLSMNPNHTSLWLGNVHSHSMGHSLVFYP